MFQRCQRRASARRIVAIMLIAVSMGVVTLPPGVAGQQDATAARALVPEMSGEPIAVFPSGALHVVGQERFAVGLVDMETGPIEDGRVDLLFFRLAGNQGTLTESLPAPFMAYGAAEGHAADHPDQETGSEITGVFVARPTFDVAGEWGVVARLTMPDGSVRAGQTDFEVVADSEVPGPGEMALASKTLVAETPEEAEAICTAEPVDDMHDLSLDTAIANGKPTLVLFATPALCTSRVCGPSLEALQDLKTRYGERANFIHIELYPERDYNQPVSTISEWHLPSEPWLFLIDEQGTIVARYEGGIGLTELDPAVEALVSNPS